MSFIRVPDMRAYRDSEAMASITYHKVGDRGAPMAELQ